MNRLFLLVLSGLIVLSCEQNAFVQLVDENLNVFSVNTKTVNSVADFEPISELSDIPVNIKNVGNPSCGFLSCKQNGQEVCLNNNDDGSLRQRWYVNNGFIFLVGGNSSIKLPAKAKVGIAYPLPDCSYPFLVVFLYPQMNGNHLFVQSGDYYYIRNVPMSFGTSGEYGKYLQPNSVGSSSLNYKVENGGSLALWEIIPVGEYEIVDFEYVKTSVDDLTPYEVVCAQDEYENLSANAVMWDYSVTTKYSETSNFSRTEGVSVSVTNGLHIGLPNLLGNSGILDVNTSIQQQMNKSWTYGNSETKDLTENRTAHITVPANTKVRLEAVIVQYAGNLTYIATLRKMDDNKTFKVKGKWSGTSFSMFKAKVYDVMTNNSIAEYTLE